MSNSFVVQYLIKAKDMFSRDSKKVVDGMKKQDKTATKLGRTYKRLGGGLRRFASDVKNSSFMSSKSLNSIKRAAQLATAAVVGLVTVGAKFQTSMADLSAITGASGKGLELLKNETLRLAKSTITSQDDIATGIKLIGSAAPQLLTNIPLLLKTTESILVLKGAGTDMETAVRSVTGGLNVFGKEAKYASTFVNILAAGALKGSSEINQTAAAVEIAGPGARSAGLSFLQLNAAIQTVAKGNIKGSQAGTALSAIFGRLREQGYDFQKLGLQGTFEKVKKHLDRFKNSTARAKEEARIFGREHGKVGLAILNNVEMLGKFEKSLAGTDDAQKQMDVRNSTFAKNLELLWIIIKDKLIKVFLKIEPMLSKMTVEFGKWIDSIDDEKLNEFAESLKAIAKGMAGIAKFGGRAAKFTGDTGKEIGEFAGAMATGNFDELVKDSPLLKKMPTNKTQTDINLKVALDKGLKQTSKAQINTSMGRDNLTFGAAM